MGLYGNPVEHLGAKGRLKRSEPAALPRLISGGGKHLTGYPGKIIATNHNRFFHPNEQAAPAEPRLTDKDGNRTRWFQHPGALALPEATGGVAWA